MENQGLRIGEVGTKPRILGKSEWARRIRTEIAKVAPRSSTVLVTGPTGTGKELLARCLHAQSPRAGRAFVPVDCAAIAGSLCASQLFGHVKGAFTGADYESLGCFRAANGGTIFLDEIGELELNIQTMLLRAIQERTVVPIGSYKQVPIDVRIIAATNRDLDWERSSGRFREDLYYRLDVVSLKTTPLVERLNDISVLADYFLEQFAAKEGLPSKRLSAEGLAELQAHDWPGNVRELQNMLERAAVFADSDLIGAGLLRLGSVARGPSIDSSGPTSDVGTPHLDWSEGDSRWQTLAEHEAEHIASTLKITGYNQSAAARRLGIDRHLLARKMKKYGLRKSLGTD